MPVSLSIVHLWSLPTTRHQHVALKLPLKYGTSTPILSQDIASIVLPQPPTKWRLADAFGRREGTQVWYECCVIRDSAWRIRWSTHFP
jgi:hypothetical protein